MCAEATRAIVASTVPEDRAKKAEGFAGPGARGRQGLPGAGRGGPGKPCRPPRCANARDGARRKASLIRNGEHTKARGWRGKESA